MRLFGYFLLALAVASFAYPALAPYIPFRLPFSDRDAVGVGVITALAGAIGVLTGRRV
jgi:hypothetical protein